MRVTFMAYTSVNNTDLIDTAKFEHDLIDDIISQMQKVVDIWGGLIQAFEGSINPF